MKIIASAIGFGEPLLISGSLILNHSSSKTEIKERIIGIVYQVRCGQEEQDYVEGRPEDSDKCLPGDHLRKSAITLCRASELTSEPRVYREGNDASQYEDEKIVSEIPQDISINHRGSGHSEHDFEIMSQLSHIIKYKDYKSRYIYEHGIQML